MREFTDHTQRFTWVAVWPAVALPPPTPDTAPLEGGAGAGGSSAAGGRNDDSSKNSKNSKQHGGAATGHVKDKQHKELQQHKQHQLDLQRRQAEDNARILERERAALRAMQVRSASVGCLPAPFAIAPHTAWRHAGAQVPDNTVVSASPSPGPAQAPPVRPQQPAHGAARAHIFLAQPTKVFDPNLVPGLGGDRAAHDLPLEPPFPFSSSSSYGHPGPPLPPPQHPSQQQLQSASSGYGAGEAQGAHRQQAPESIYGLLTAAGGSGVGPSRPPHSSNAPPWHPHQHPPTPPSDHHHHHHEHYHQQPGQWVSEGGPPAQLHSPAPPWAQQQHPSHRSSPPLVLSGTPSPPQQQPHHHHQVSQHPLPPTPVPGPRQPQQQQQQQQAAASPASQPRPDSPPDRASGGGRRFMGGLAQLRAGPSQEQAEAAAAQRAQWVRELDEQVRLKREREAQRKAQELALQAKVSGAQGSRGAGRGRQRSGAQASVGRAVCVLTHLRPEEAEVRAHQRLQAEQQQGALEQEQQQQHHHQGLHQPPPDPPPARRRSSRKLIDADWLDAPPQHQQQHAAAATAAPAPPALAGGPSHANGSGGAGTRPLGGENGADATVPQPAEGVEGMLVALQREQARLRDEFAQQMASLQQVAAGAGAVAADRQRAWREVERVRGSLLNAAAGPALGGAARAAGGAGGRGGAHEAAAGGEEEEEHEDAAGGGQFVVSTHLLPKDAVGIPER